MRYGNIDRRNLMLGASAWAALGGVSTAGEFFTSAAAEPSADGEKPFTFEALRKQAEELAAADFVPPKAAVEEPFDKLTAEQYRDIRFRPERTIGRGDNADCEIQLLPLGWLYDNSVEISLLEAGVPRAQKADGKMFAFGPLIERAPEDAPYGFSGLRILGPINRAEAFEEYAIFQGASYFRALGRAQTFGVSARGLAIDTAQASGEEFPVFRAFYVEKPKPSARAVMVYALLDSPSVTGAYRFSIVPGEMTVIDVAATLYPRRELTHAGLAPLTSMFLHGPASHRVNGDVRPAVHNSEGLAIFNGKGERLWRPLNNPAKLQTSAFVDQDVKGFGLCQRDRSFAMFEDLSAHFERRPTIWVEPSGPWGKGYVELIEIPAEEQIHDNIVAYWKPAQPLEPGKAFSFGYKLSWGHDIPVAWAGIRARKTRVGMPKRDNEDLRVFVIDFDGPGLQDLSELPQAELTVSYGSTANLMIERNPAIDGLRVSFDLDTAGSETVELRLALKAGNQLISENWLFRWTRA